MPRRRDPMARMVASLREGTLEAVLEGPIAGCELALDVPEGAGAWLHEAPGAADAPRPALFELHGGGFALGDARKEDALCSWIARRFDVHVVGVNYRLAPEHPFPAGLDDVEAVMRAVATRADELRIDPSRLYAMGYSAGANLAVAAAMRLAGGACAGAISGAGQGAGEAVGNAAAPTSGPRLAGLLLHYPSLDCSRDPRDGAPREIDLPVELMEAFTRWYVGEGDAADPFASPACAPASLLAALPRTLVYPVVGDVLEAEARRFAAQVREAGGDAVLRPVEGVYHGYIEDAANLRVYRETNLPETIEARPANAPRVAVDVLAEGLSELLGGRGDARVAADFLADEDAAGCAACGAGR